MGRIRLGHWAAGLASWCQLMYLVGPILTYADGRNGPDLAEPLGRDKVSLKAGCLGHFAMLPIEEHLRRR